jgi:hypothetical protein
MTDDDVPEVIRRLEAVLERHGLDWVTRRVDLDRAEGRDDRELAGLAPQRRRLIALIDRTDQVITSAFELEQAVPDLLLERTQLEQVVILGEDGEDGEGGVLLRRGVDPQRAEALGRLRERLDRLRGEALERDG